MTWNSRRSVRARLATIAAAALSAGLLAAPAVAAGGTTDDGVIPGAWIVTLHSGESPDRVAEDHRRNEGAQVDQIYRYALHGYAARMSETAAARVARDSRVASVVADREVSIDKPGGKPGGDGGTATPAPQTVPFGVQRIRTPNSSLPTGPVDVDVAVIDTGIDLDHPDLDVRAGKNCVRSGSADDGNGHGTHVAGTIGARNDEIGVVGVAPGARLWAVRVLDNRGSGSWSQVICGIDWVTANADTIEVANMSLGGSGTETVCNDGGMHQAICRAVSSGVTFVVAAGNEADDAANHVPAAYDEVITVSALADFNGVAGGGAPSTCRADVDDTFADFSNYGADVDLIAPGVCINSTWKGGGYNTISGTSMASPHVAGAAALYTASNAAASPADVRTALQAAGNDYWNNDDDGDRTKERLLSVAGM